MIPNGYLIFEDENFLDSTVAKMNALRKNGQFCDVRLQVCGHELMAHRAVLACCSPYLFEIFNSDLEPHGVSHVKFEDLDPEAVEILLNYAYTAQLKADKELVKEVYSAAKRLKMDRVKQICGDYLLSKMDSQSAISYRNFASCMGDGRLLGKIDSYIQEHLLDVSEQEDFLKLPRLKLEVMLEDNLTLPSNGKLYSKVIGWVQRSLWENGEPLERLMEEVQTLYYSADHKLLDGSLLDGQAEVFGTEDDHIQFVQKKPPRENVHRQLSTSSSGSLSPGSAKLSCKQEWKYIASEKTTNNTYLCLAVLNGVLCVIFLHGRSSPQASPSATPCLTKSLSFEGQPLEEEPEKLLAPMHYARSGLGIAGLQGRLIAAGVCSLNNKLYVVGGSDPCGQKGLKNCDVFDPVSKAWTSCAPLNIRRHQAAVCELDGFMYVIGGAESWNCLNSVERYNPENNTWTLVAPMNIARRGAGVAVYEGKLFVVGGFDGSHALRCVEMYDPARNEWRMLGSMNSPRSNAGAAVLGDIIYAVGGFDGNDFLNSVEAYNPKTDEWSPCADAFTDS
ncbi:influenza virus NS1A-binding [Labeo rohita]|uniref:Influenza virus NS1A-binding n=1 Tax=Labeo rohita TaxID=84645 RepID=A0A498M832_LABRO|nr:influenza virus NS1A-binding [Labeo rohita]RXN16821.1 influenza virus NS1A-binding [Labeo rohita]